MLRERTRLLFFLFFFLLLLFSVSSISILTPTASVIVEPEVYQCHFIGHKVRDEGEYSMYNNIVIVYYYYNIIICVCVGPQSSGQHSKFTEHIKTP